MDEVKNNISSDIFKAYAQSMEEAIPQTGKFITQRYDAVRAAMAAGKMDAKAIFNLSSLVVNVISLENLRSNRYPSVRKSTAAVPYRHLINYERERVSAKANVRSLIKSLSESPQQLEAFMADPQKGVASLCDGRNDPAPDYSEVKYLKMLRNNAAKLRRDIGSLPQSPQLSQLGSALDSFRIDDEIRILSDPNEKNLLVRDRAYERVGMAIKQLMKPVVNGERKLPTEPAGPDRTNLKNFASNLIGLMQNVAGGADHVRGIDGDSRELTEEEKAAAANITQSLDSLRAQCISVDDAVKSYTVTLRRYLDSTIGQLQSDYRRTLDELDPSPAPGRFGAPLSKPKQMSMVDFIATSQHRQSLENKIKNASALLTDTKKAVMNFNDNTLLPLEQDIQFAAEKMKLPQFAADPEYQSAVKEFITQSLGKAQQEFDAMRQQMQKEPETVERVKPFFENLENKMQAFTAEANKVLGSFSAPDAPEAAVQSKEKSPEEAAWDKLTANVDELVKAGTRKATDHFQATNDAIDKIYDRKFSHAPSRPKRTKTELSDKYQSAVRTLTGEIFSRNLTGSSRKALTGIVTQMVSDSNIITADALERQGKSSAALKTDAKELRGDKSINDYVNSLMNSPEELGKFLGDPVESIKPLTQQALRQAEQPANSPRSPSEERIALQRQRLQRCAKLLEDSRTLVNSEEYRDLIKFTKDAASGKSMKDLGNMSMEEKFAQQLYMVHAATERYLSHKAADGVKRNVYKKLVAVEKTNKLLEECLRDLGDVKLTLNSVDSRLPQRTGDLAVNLSDRHRAHRRKFGEEASVPEMKEDYRPFAEAFKQKDPSVRGSSTDQIADCIKDADSCMCKIILHAAANMDMSATRTLTSMRNEFLNNPFPPEKEAQTQAAQKKTTAPVR